MTDRALGLMGLMRRAGAIEIGTDRACDALRDGKARLLLLASDAGENAAARVERTAEGRSAVLLRLPFTKTQLSQSLGAGDCAAAAVTDIGFAQALADRLAEEDAESYSAAAGEIRAKREKIELRKKSKGSKGQPKKTGKRRTDI